MIGFYFPQEERFEYDIRGLLGAFFPGEEIVKLEAEPEDPADWHLIYPVPQPDDSLPYEEIKNSFKRQVYDELSALTGRRLPWGTLTGIRPAKLIMQQLEAGKRPVEIADHMRRTYYLDGEKLSLAIAVAQREKAVLSRLRENGYSLYVGIPFCPSRCLYCSFTSYPLERFADRIDAYLDTLLYEMKESRKLFEGRPLDTVYIGGGTPTALSPDQLKRLLDAICRTFPTEDLLEFTVEAGRPDSISEEKLRVMRQYPVSRLSINPQTMQQRTLDLIGRRHRVEEIPEAFGMARAAGFTDINMDIILGLPGETAQDVADTMEQLERLRPDSVTVHSLAVKRASRLKTEASKGMASGADAAESKAMMQLSARAAQEMGLFPYYLYRQKNIAGNLENVGYARPGAEGVYNILMMEEKQDVLALGAGNISKAVYADGLIRRADNVKELGDYAARIDEMIERKRSLWA